MLASCVDADYPPGALAGERSFSFCRLHAGLSIIGKFSLGGSLGIAYYFAMPFPLGYAEAADSSGSDVFLILICVAALVVTAAFAFAVIGLARMRNHKQSDAIAAFAVLWGILVVGSVLMAASAQMKWSREKMLRIQSGYFDPQDNSDAPTLPLKAWVTLGLGYGAIGVWAVASLRTTDRP